MSASLELTAKLTGLDYSGKIVTYGVSYTLRNDDEKRQELIQKVADMQKDYQH
ncbi:hypothetical protein [Ligilactobacillus ruminis]|uniref:Uncharacterized protein n=2 Tax=Ligilactobacillus ruminis TaxID=1623 RepID=A0A837IS96_9LACO|nr:hypothetical protein [Ligilactobacillus ruminis]KLA46708.1 hypothetical protein LRB_722 [Ligilactobacillus ruminis]SFG38241.1 hypothetical protein SAMN02910432_01140 [Ligilactobacillus ruminis DSM 20403 = NBRC 102161]